MIIQTRHNGNGLFSSRMSGNDCDEENIKRALHLPIWHLVWSTRRIYLGSGLKCICMTSAYGLYFLWQGDTAKRVTPEREPSKKMRQKLPIFTQCDLHHTLLVKAVMNPPKFKRLVLGPYLSMRKGNVKEFVDF